MTYEYSQLESLVGGPLRQILNNLGPQEVIAACLTSKTVRSECTEQFWCNKLAQDFPKYAQPQGKCQQLYYQLGVYYDLYLRIIELMIDSVPAAELIDAVDYRDYIFADTSPPIVDASVEESGKYGDRVILRSNLRHGEEESGFIDIRLSEEDNLERFSIGEIEQLFGPEVAVSRYLLLGTDTGMSYVDESQGINKPLTILGALLLLVRQGLLGELEFAYRTLLPMTWDEWLNSQSAVYQYIVAVRLDRNDRNGAIAYGPFSATIDGITALNGELAEYNKVDVGAHFGIERCDGPKRLLSRRPINSQQLRLIIAIKHKVLPLTERIISSNEVLRV
jgi:hypothetical protein